MKFVTLLVVILACTVEAEDHMEVKRSGTDGQSFLRNMTRFFQETTIISNRDCNYLHGLNPFISDPDIIQLSRMLNGWMCDFPFGEAQVGLAQGINLLTQAFLTTFEENSGKLSKTGDTGTGNDVMTESPTSTSNKRGEAKAVLYVGTGDTTNLIDIYDWIEDSVGLEKRTSLKVKSAAQNLVLDASRTRLISVEKAINQQQDLEVFDLKAGAGQQPVLKNSNHFEQSEFTFAALHATSKYLLMSSSVSGKVAAMELMDDGKLNVVATYQPEKASFKISMFAIHPIARGALAAVSSSSSEIGFLSFDSLAKTIKAVSQPQQINNAFQVHFFHDPNTMYLSGQTNTILIGKAYYDHVKNEISAIDPISKSFTTEDQRSEITTDVYMAGGLSGKFLYTLTVTTNTVTVFAIDLPTGKLSPLQYHNIADGSGEGKALAISPDGTNLLVADYKNGIYVFKIDGEGKVTQSALIKGSIKPQVLLYTTP